MTNKKTYTCQICNQTVKILDQPKHMLQYHNPNLEQFLTNLINSLKVQLIIANRNYDVALDDDKPLWSQVVKDLETMIAEQERTRSLIREGLI